MVTGCGMGGRVSVSGRDREIIIVAISAIPALCSAVTGDVGYFFPPV